MRRERERNIKERLNREREKKNSINIANNSAFF